MVHVVNSFGALKDCALSPDTTAIMTQRNATGDIGMQFGFRFPTCPIPLMKKDVRAARYVAQVVR